MDDDIEEIPDSESTSTNVALDSYLKRGKRVSWTGENAEGLGPSLNANAYKQKTKLEDPQESPDDQSSEDIELKTRPSRKKQTVVSDDDSVSIMKQEITSQNSVDADDSRSRSYSTSSRLSVSAELDESIRDRIRNKFADVYTKAQQKERFSRRLTVLRQKSLIDMRAVEEATEENVEEKLQKSFQKHDILMQQVPTPKSVEEILPPADVQYNFFTAIYDSSKPDDHKHTVELETPQSKKEEEEIIETPQETLPEESDEAKRLMKQLASWTPTVMTRAHPIAFSDQMAKEQMIYFIPSFFPRGATTVAPNEQRRLEEEGLYVPENVALPKRNISTMEERLQKTPEKGLGWFGDDGKLISVAPSLANFPSRLDTTINPKLDTAYTKATMARRGVTGIETYQLDIDVSKLMFTHHVLFSKENVLAMRLMELYKNYLQRSQEQLSRYLGQKLQAIIETIRTFEANPENPEALESITLYRKEARDLRRRRNNEETLDRQLLQNILRVWNTIKRLRQKQNYITTSLQLYLRKQDIDANADRTIWEADLMEELREQEIEYAQWCQRQLEAFHAAKEKEPERPYENTQIEPPQFAPFDRETAWNQLVKTSLKTRRNPGEPIFIPVLGSNTAITPLEKCPDAEKERRQEIARTRMSMKIYFNDMEVCSTSTRPLNSDFCVTFGQVFNLHVYEWPQSIRIKIFETSGVAVGGGWEEVAVIYVPVPSVSQVTTPGVDALEEIEFSNPNTQSKSHAGVGSGVPIDFQVEGQNSIIPRTSGVLQCSALWGRAKDGTPLAPPSKLEDEKEKFSVSMGPGSVAAIEELQQMLKTSKFDPNDPENVRFYSIIKDVEAITKGSSKQLECFRLEPAECELVPEDVFLRNPRFRLLQLRSEQVPEFRNMNMIPAVPREIATDIFTEYESRTTKEKEKLELSDLDAYRQAADKYLAAVRAQVIQRLSTVQQTKSLQDVVNEEPLPTLGALTLLFEEKGRPLKPARSERKRVFAQNLAGVQVNLSINVVRAFNLPVRDDKTSLGFRPDHIKAETPKIEPYVEANFQGQTARTSVLQGPNPTWNQQLLMAFTPPNGDYSPSNLQTVTDPIVINLFDRIVTPLPHDDREGDTTVHQQIEKRWLGTMQIPFCTVYYNGKISGAFRLKVPPILLGYTIPTKTDALNVFPHLHIFMAIDPPLMTPEPIRGRFESIETEAMVNYAIRWVHKLQELHPMRRYVPLVVDLNGRSSFVCRFLRPIRPPPEVEALGADKKSAANLACRIVSMIPFVSDPVLFPGLCDIWSSCDQFLDMSCGDEEEHAILLWCWLSGLGLPCHLLLGNAIPEGPRSAYVLAQLPGAPVLYNASDGVSYSVNDSLCPLRSVGCAITPENVWANIQSSEHPTTMSFDFMRSLDWRPFFDKKFPNPGLATIQPETLTYFDPDPVSVLELQEKIERTIREKLMLWRPHLITRWNRYAAQILRQLLPLMETTNLVEDVEERHVQALQSLYDSYKISGFPLNSGYIAIDRIADAVYATNVHANASPDVEFALAVYVHAYTNNILSVWVYIASLVKRR